MRDYNNSDKIAEAAILYANQKIKASTTSLGFNDQTSEEQAGLEASLREARMRGRTYESQFNIKTKFDRLDVDETLFQFHHALEGAVESGMGNCGELSAFALQYCSENYPNIRCEMFEIYRGDHVFLVINREENSDKNNPLTWGAAIICDPLNKVFYPVENYLVKLQNYSYKKDGDKTINSMEDFDPKLHCLMKIERFDTQYIASFNTHEHIEKIKIYFQVKLVYIKMLLLELKSQADIEPDERNTLLQKRIAAIDSFLEKIKNPSAFVETLAHGETGGTYASLRNFLISTLRQEIINEFTGLLAPLEKQVSSPGLFSSTKNIESLRSFDHAREYVTKLFDNINTCERDWDIMLSMKNNPTQSEITDQVRLGIDKGMQSLKH